MTRSNPVRETDAGSVDRSSAIDAFSSLAETWELSTDEKIKLLGSPARSTFFKWKKEGGNLPNDTTERISHLLSIYKALEILLPDPQAADKWIKTENEFFDGNTALEVMLGGQVIDIYKVREYVDAQRGG